MNAPIYDARMRDVGVIRPKPGKHKVEEIDRKTGSTVYAVEYSIDKHSRRIANVKDVEQRDKFILFFGDSFAFGVGVEDHQTLAYQVGELSDKYTPYNYGMSSLGPFDVLALIENTDFDGEVAEKTGILVYTFIDGHIHRVIGASSTMDWVHKAAYYSKDKDGKFIRNGSFETGRPLLTALYRVLDKSRILKLMAVSFPLRIGNAHKKLISDVIQQMKMSFKEKYPEAEFYVLIYPGAIIGSKLTDHFDELGIRYLDYSDIFVNNDPKYILSRENSHPSPLAYRTIAQKC